MTAQPSSPVGRRAAPAPEPTDEAAPRPSWRGRLGEVPRRPLLLGLVASLLMVLGGFGAGGVLVRDPLLSNTALGFWRFGHGRELATALIYLGVALMAWAWVQLGRDVLADRVRGRAVLLVAGAWTAPMVFSAPLFTRDVFSYLAQGSLPLAGLNPYEAGVEELPGVFTDNVHPFWQDTPAPYGPLFILLARTVAALSGDNVILGVVLMKLALLPGLALYVWAIPELTRRIGGRVPVALWVAVANPVMVIHMVGGGHNDLLVVGLLAVGALAALKGRHVTGIALATAAMAVKASAGLALPFLVLVWAGHLVGSRRARIAKAGAAGLAVFAAVFGTLTLVAGVGLGWLPALSAPSMIVNWMSLPTGVGELFYAAVRIFAEEVPKTPFVTVTRILGGLLFAYIAVRQWLAARDGGPDAVRRAGIVLVAAAVLGPANLPWYVSWGMALLAAAAWNARGLAVVVFGSLMLIIAYYPHGEDALYNWPYIVACALLSALAAVSLLRPDPLRLRAGARPARRPAPAEPVASGAEHRAR